MAHRAFIIITGIIIWYAQGSKIIKQDAIKTLKTVNTKKNMHNKLERKNEY